MRHTDTGLIVVAGCLVDYTSELVHADRWKLLLGMLIRRTIDLNLFSVNITADRVE